MKIKIFLMILSLTLINCGPSEEEAIEESTCNNYYEKLLEYKEIVRSFDFDEILDDEETASAYRDEIDVLLDYNAYIINSCDEILSSFIISSERAARDLYISRLYRNLGYWDSVTGRYELEVEKVNYEDAFFMIYGGDDITLSQKEFEKTLRLLEKWEWGDKQDQENEKFRIISIDGYECVKVWTSMPTALLTSTHPLEKYSNNNYIYESQNFSTYNCMENLDLENFDGEFYLYGQPFFYDDKWWLFKPFEPNRELISDYCLVDCFTSWQDFAAPEAILKTDPIYLEK